MPRPVASAFPLEAEVQWRRVDLPAKAGDETTSRVRLIPARIPAYNVDKRERARVVACRRARTRPLARDGGGHECFSGQDATNGGQQVSDEAILHDEADIAERE